MSMTNWKSTLCSLGAALLLGGVGAGSYHYLTSSSASECCKQGAACCKPGAECCKRHAHPSNEPG
ncbi:MAG: hypothetical protein QM778_31950 [Myxococcales bacterium]